MLYETSLKHALEQQAYILFYELGCESEAAVEVIDTEAVIRNVSVYPKVMNVTNCLFLGEEVVFIAEES